MYDNLDEMYEGLDEEQKEELRALIPNWESMTDGWLHSESHVKEMFAVFNVTYPTNPKYPYFSIRSIRNAYVLGIRNSADPRRAGWYQRDPDNKADYHKCYYCDFSIPEKNRPSLFCSRKCQNESPNGSKMAKVYKSIWAYYLHSWSEDWDEAVAQLKAAYSEHQKQKDEKFDLELKQRQKSGALISQGCFFTFAIVVSFLVFKFLGHI